MKKTKTLRVLVALAAVGALAVVMAGGGPAAANTSGKTTTVIKMKKKGKDLFFKGPATVEAGTNLKIKNQTNPKQVGPHTFSLVAPNTLPTTNQQIKACGKKLKGICGAVVQWHDVDIQTNEIGENPVEVGKQGWDRQGNLKKKGDSWIAERKGESFSRKVTAKPGKTLHYFCAVHPFMQGEIEVVK